MSAPRRSPPASYEEALALQEAGKLEEARRVYAELLRLDPSHARAHNNLGAILHREGDLAGAIAHYEQALRAKPELFDAARNLAIACSVRGEHARAESFARRALALEPAAAEARQLLADVLLAAGAQHSFNGDGGAAIACFEEAIALDPDSASAHFYLGLERLSVGDYEHAWPEHEWRWKLPEFAAQRPESLRPYWDGGALRGRTLLLHAEQGFGDAIQFVRYASLLAKQGAKVLVRCPPHLVTLMRHATGVSGAVSDEDPALPAFDASFPLLSLPAVFRTARSSIPLELPYLHPAADQVREWRARLGEEGPRVGLVWGSFSGSDVLVRRKSIPVERLAPLGAARPGLRLFSLQKGPHQEELARMPAGLVATNLAPLLRDFSDTAAAIINLDLVISVDTAVAHLAGALAKPVWTLAALPLDWRWAGEGRSAWYPTMRVFRQPRHGDWDSVIADVAAALSRWDGG